MPLFFKVPFGTSGDRTAIPITGTEDGVVNYTYGFGSAYSLPLSTDPAALSVPRVSFNELMFDVTSNIQQYQQHGVPEFITTADNGGSAFPYAADAMVRYDNGVTVENYISLTASNVALPTDTAHWTQFSNNLPFLNKANTYTAIQTISVNGTPLIVSSLDSTAQKIQFKDAATARGYIGAGPNYCLGVHLAAGTFVGGWDTSGFLRPGAASTYDLGTTGLPWRNIYAGAIGPASSDLHTLQAVASSTVALYSNNLSVFAATTSAQLAGIISDETGTGSLVFSNGPVFVAPALGTPISGVATNFTGTAAALNIGGNAATATTASAVAVGGITGLGANVAAFLASPSSANFAAAVTGETGTGAVVFATSPALITPALGVASATSLALTSTAGIIGTTTNNNADAGSVGEYISSVIGSGSAVSLTTGTPINVTSIILTAGDWDIRGCIDFALQNTTSLTDVRAGINTVTGTLPNSADDTKPFCNYHQAAGVGGSGNTFTLALPTGRVSLSTTTTYFLVARSDFTIGTNAAYGWIAARRVR